MKYIIWLTDKSCKGGGGGSLHTDYREGDGGGGGSCGILYGLITMKHCSLKYCIMYVYNARIRSTVLLYCIVLRKEGTSTAHPFH